MTVNLNMIEKILNENRVEEFFNLSSEEQRLSYFHKGKRYEEVHFRLQETDKNVVLSRMKKSVVYSKGYFYPKTQEEGKFCYNKVEKKVKFNTFGKEGIIDALIVFPQFDWLNNAYENHLVESKLFCDSIIRDILIGKLTNAESIVKKYLQLNKIKGVNWKTFVRYLRAKYFPIAWVQTHTTNPNVAMELMTHSWNNKTEGESKELYEKRNIFFDMFREALALNVKINPQWSLKRMREEHTKMTRNLMKIDLAEKEQVDIYNGCPKFDYPCKLLSTEGEVFVEGEEMHHCIYTCYWNAIKEYRYLAFSFQFPQRFTLGLKLTDKGWEYDQAYLKYDNPINEDSKAMIEQFLGDPNVIQTIKEKIPKGKVDYSDLPF